MVKSSPKFILSRALYKYKRHLKEANRTIRMIMDLAQTDFITTIELFHNYIQSDVTNPSLLIASDALRKLQYKDTLCETLTHIAMLQEALLRASFSLEDNNEEDSAAFVFHLNYLQAVSAHAAFVDAVYQIRHIAHELNTGHIFPEAALFNEHNVFTRFRAIENLFSTLLYSLKIMYTERCKEHVITSTSPVSKQIEALYTMDSERFVLRWLEVNSEGDTDQLLKAYLLNGFGCREK